MQLRLATLLLILLCSLGVTAQTVVVGPNNSTGTALIKSNMRLEKRAGSGIRVGTYYPDGTAGDTTLASLISDAIRLADTNIIVPSMYRLSTDLATKLNISNVVDNLIPSTINVPNTATVASALVSKVDTSSAGVYVYSRQQLKNAINYATKIIIASDTITVDTILYPKTGTTIMGMGRGKSKISASTENTYGIFNVLSVNNVTISDLELVGEGANIDPTSNSKFYTTAGMIADSNIGTSRGILVNNVQRVYLTNLYVHNFSKAGIEVQNTGVSEPARMGLIVDNVFLTNNYYGIYGGNSGQYNTFNNIVANYNICGFGKRTGNLTITGSHFTNNRVGYFSGFGANAAHGSIIGSLINHNYLRGILISSITSGEIITSCHVYDAGIEVLASAGVQISNCLIECAVTVDGVGTNTVHDNILSLESGGGNITNTGVGAFFMYNNNSIPDRNNRTVNNDLIRRLRQFSSTEIEPIEHVVTAATTGMWDFRHPLVSLSGGILVKAEFDIALYGSPGTHAKMVVQAYPNTTTAVTTAYLTATVTGLTGGALPFTRVSVGIAPDGQFQICIADTNTAVPVSKIEMTKCSFWQTGNQGNQVNYIGGKWTSRITNTNVGRTSVRNITPTYGLTDAASTVTSLQIRDTTILPIDMKPSVTRSSAATLTLAYGGEYTFTGTTTTYTLPAIAAATLGRAQLIIVTNGGSGNITLNTNASANVLYLSTNTLTNTLSITPGQTYYLRPDGVNFIVQLQ